MSNDKLKIKEIKSTSELGCMLDTERPWVKITKPKWWMIFYRPRFPNSIRDVEVMLKDGTVSIGWKVWSWHVANKNSSINESWDFPSENMRNPVVAWRELVTDNTEKR